MNFDQFEPEHNSLESESQPQRPSVLKRLLRLTREVLETIVPAVLIALLINLFLAQATRVYGQSMEPNLHTDQRLIVEKLSYNRMLRQSLGFDGPQRGDVVVINLENQNNELLIKRVIGLPGDTIEIRDSQVYVNNQPLQEPYLADVTTGYYPPTVVPPLHIFVLGDNRNFSNDSRNFGTIPLKNVVGRAWFSYWPPDQVGFVH
jgi:signal peptidase I